MQLPEKNSKWKKWLIVSALLLVGLFIFTSYKEAEFLKKKEFVSGESDKIPPLTAVMSPADKSWHNKDFKAVIRDSDLGLGFENGKCEYIIEDLGTGRVSGGLRDCELSEIAVFVGEEKVCSSSYQKDDISQGKCKLSTRAFDSAGNDSGWQSRVFNIDLIKPKIEIINFNQPIVLDKNYTFQAIVSDNSKIIGCWFYLNGKLMDIPVKINPIPCGDGDDCNVSVNYSFNTEGDYFINFSCKDIAGNYSFGEVMFLNDNSNTLPKITSCKASPIQGNVATKFQFTVNAADPDGDKLFYQWIFGDGETSQKANPDYQYLFPGTYEPKVIVSDINGGSAECSTAWIVVNN